MRREVKRAAERLRARARAHTRTMIMRSRLILINTAKTRAPCRVRRFLNIIKRRKKRATPVKSLNRISFSRAE